MPRKPVATHPLRHWQEDLEEKLKEPFSDREVVFAIDQHGNARKTWFANCCEEKHGKSIQVGADKHENLSCEVINIVIEDGTPNVVFMDAPRSRSLCMSSAWSEETKNGVTKSPKCKSKKAFLTHIPHVVVVMNAFPKC